MRLMNYDCYMNDTLVSTTTDYNKAEEWKAMRGGRDYKVRLTEIHKVETPEEREKRLATIQKRRIAMAAQKLAQIHT